MRKQAIRTLLRDCNEQFFDSYFDQDEADDDSAAAYLMGYL
jgi:hypothetical protein